MVTAWAHPEDRGLAFVVHLPDQSTLEQFTTSFRCERHGGCRRHQSKSSYNDGR